MTTATFTAASAAALSSQSGRRFDLAAAASAVLAALHARRAARQAVQAATVADQRTRRLPTPCWRPAATDHPTALWRSSFGA